MAKENDTDVSVTNSNTMVPAGTYTDKITGSTFTVTDKTITGHVGSSGIAVIYDGTPQPTVAPTQAPTQAPTTPPTQAPTEPARLLGDIDGDEDVSVIDVTLLQRKLAGIDIPYVFVDKVADADEDDDVTVIDVTYIQRWLAGIPSNDNIGKPIT